MCVTARAARSVRARELTLVFCDTAVGFLQYLWKDLAGTSLAGTPACSRQSPHQPSSSTEPGNAPVEHPESVAGTHACTRSPNAGHGVQYVSHHSLIITRGRSTRLRVPVLGRAAMAQGAHGIEHMVLSFR